jgi:hypothetical protein
VIGDGLVELGHCIDRPMPFARFTGTAEHVVTVRRKSEVIDGEA